MKVIPNFDLEESFWQKGKDTVVGIDEVGRGCFAGPVVAGAVVFKKPLVEIQVKIDDSKKLTPRQREKSSIWIKKNCLWATGESSALEINNLGIVRATSLAFIRALEALQKSFSLVVNHLLIDGENSQLIDKIDPNNQTRINKGDSLSMSIAAASIVAKVERDSLMDSLSQDPRFAIYEWSKNKGYGTKRHREVIKSHGPCELHRLQFIRKYL